MVTLDRFIELFARLSTKRWGTDTNPDFQRTTISSIRPWCCPSIFADKLDCRRNHPGVPHDSWHG